MKDKEFDIQEARKLLKQVVKERKASITNSEHSFEDPGIYTDRRKAELSSLPSTIDEHFANIQVQLKSKQMASVYKDNQNKKATSSPPKKTTP